LPIARIIVSPITLTRRARILLEARRTLPEDHRMLHHNRVLEEAFHNRCWEAALVLELPVVALSETPRTPSPFLPFLLRLSADSPPSAFLQPVSLHREPVSGLP